MDVVAADAGPLFITAKSKLAPVDTLAMAMNNQTSRVVDLIRFTAVQKDARTLTSNEENPTKHYSS